MIMSTAMKGTYRRQGKKASDNALILIVAALFAAFTIFFLTDQTAFAEEVKKMPKESAQEEWKRKTIEYVAAINAHVEKGLRDGWENVGDEPDDPGREHLVDSVLTALRKANETGKLDGFRDLWPPAHRPLIEKVLKKKGQSIPTVCILPDGSILARIGAVYEKGRVVHIVGDEVRDLPGIEYFGRGPNRRYFAVAGENKVRILDGWNGPLVAECPWPKGLEDLPDGLIIEPFSSPPMPTKLIPFPDGKKVLLVGSSGIFVLAESGARRLLPTKQDIKESYQWHREEYPDEKTVKADWVLDLSMDHGAVSKDGKWIAVGAQHTKHLVFNDRLEPVGDIGHPSEYPHYAVFSSDDSLIAFNSCHFYNGVTIGVPTNLLPGLKTENYEEDGRTPVLEDEARVYAAVGREDDIIIGDAMGYVRAFDVTGKPMWRHFIGSSVGDIDISADGKILAVSTYAGFLSIIRLDAGRRAPYQIGNGNHLELRRWIFWKNEPTPLIW